VDQRINLPVNTVLDGSYRIMRVVGSGGFGITYEAEDINLGTMVAIKEYYPFDFGDRDHSMSVRPKSDRHKQTFEWGRSNFLQEARTLARFEHASIVRVTRVFEANATAYMVMRFEQGLSFEDWLRRLGRPPTQDELDSVVAPLLDALQMMHAANFLHRDIAPDNIIIRPDGSPVLLDFGAARRAVAEMSRSITGIVKAGYSPHEQYSSDSRLQGPWSDLYALGATLYRAISGRPPEESMLRFDEDHMAPAAQAAKGLFRPQFLAGIDACLKVRHAERPRSVTELRPMLLGTAPSPPKSRPPETRKTLPPVDPGRSAGPPRASRRWPAATAVVLAVLALAYGAVEYRRYGASEQGLASLSVVEAEGKRAAERVIADRQREQQEKEAAAARKRLAAIKEAKRQEEKRIADFEDMLRSEARRKEELLQREEEEKRRLAALEVVKRKEAEAAAEEARRKAAAEVQEQLRLAALEETRRAEARRQAEEAQRLAAIPDEDKRTELVRRVQLLLKRGHCWTGALSGKSAETQDGLDKFVAAARKRGKSKPVRIELAKASVGDFESWLRDADTIKEGLCAPPPETRAAPTTASRPAPPERPRRAESSEAPARSNSDNGMGPERRIRCWSGKEVTNSRDCWGR
jgi:serine/threonine protein kinase